MNKMRDYLKKENVLDEDIRLHEIHKRPMIKAKDYLKCLGFNAKRSISMIKNGKLFEGQRKVLSLDEEIKSDKIKIKLF